MRIVAHDGPQHNSLNNMQAQAYMYWAIHMFTLGSTTYYVIYLVVLTWPVYLAITILII